MGMIIDVVTPMEQAGIRYHGVEYVVDPKLADLQEATRILKDGKTQDDVMMAIILIIPEFPIADVHISEIKPILDAITKVVAELKNAPNPAV